MIASLDTFSLPAGLALRLSNHFALMGVDPRHLCRADLILALLQIGTREARSCAEGLLGKPIQICPSAVPPWPPKPVARPPGGKATTRVKRVKPNPCLPTTQAFQKFKLLKVGMTRQQLIARGITNRDLRVWSKAGHVEFSP